MKRFYALLFASLLSFTLAAAEDSPDNLRSRGGREGRPGMRRRGGMGGGFFGTSMLQRFKAEKEISQKFPKEYAEAEKQLFEAEAKLRELAKKAKVTLQDSMESKLRDLKHKQPEAFAKIVSEEDNRKAGQEIMALAKDNGIELFSGMRFRRRPDNEQKASEPARRRVKRVDFNKLRKLYPEEIKKIEALRASDPKAFQDGLRELNNKMEAEQSAARK